MVVSTKLLASSMKRAHALFVFVIARLCAPKSESLFLMSLLFNSGLACLIHVSSVLTSKRRDHFNSEHLKSVHSKKKAVASVHDLMDDAARVRSLEYAAAFDLFTSERDADMIAASVSATYLQRNADH